METIEAISRFLSSYPTWAKALFLSGIIVSIGVLVLAPRTLPDGGSNSNSSGLVLRVHRVDLFPPNESASVQVKAIINGIEFVYPSIAGVKWLKVAPSMAAQNFSLPKADRYELRFEMLLRQRGYGEAKFVSVDTVSFDGPSAEDSYALYGYDPASQMRSATTSAQVVFSVVE